MSYRGDQGVWRTVADRVRASLAETSQASFTFLLGDFIVIGPRASPAGLLTP